jgi:hypothetical protein
VGGGRGPAVAAELRAEAGAVEAADAFFYGGSTDLTRELLPMPVVKL